MDTFQFITCRTSFNSHLSELHVNLNVCEIFVFWPNMVYVNTCVPNEHILSGFTCSRLKMRPRHLELGWNLPPACNAQHSMLDWCLYDNSALHIVVVKWSTLLVYWWILKHFDAIFILKFIQNYEIFWEMSITENCSGFTQGDSLHDSMKCGGSILNQRHISNMLNRALDVYGKFSLTQDAVVASCVGQGHRGLAACWDCYNLSQNLSKMLMKVKPIQIEAVWIWYSNFSSRLNLKRQTKSYKYGSS